MTTIARELVRRGHRATAFNFPDVEELARKEGVEFCPVGGQRHPMGSVQRNLAALGRTSGMKLMMLGLQLAQLEISILLDEAVAAMKASGVTALIVDQGQPAGSTLAERLGVPFISVCAATHFDPDPAVAPPIFGWGPAISRSDRLRNWAAWHAFDKAMTPLLRTVNHDRKAWNLKRLSSIYETFSPLLELTQDSLEFDFPRDRPPSQLHYIGFLHRTHSAEVPFPFDRLDGRPVVYASLGTVYNNPAMLRTIAEACASFAVQLVITLGGKGDIDQYGDLPGSPVLVNYAPQYALLERASLTICHGGHNTVMESLAHGVPVVSIPVVKGDTGVAARLRHAGAGDWISPNDLTAKRLRVIVRRLLADPTVRLRAQAIGLSLQRAGGERRAADLIEQKLGLS